MRPSACTRARCARLSWISARAMGKGSPPWSSSAGNMIVVQHMNGITTEYFHLSKFGDGIKAGARVKQKQLIGLVGNTGMSTGSHLHFGMLRAGLHVDPAKQKFPNARPIPKEYRDELQRFVAPLLAQLQALDRA